MKNQRRGAINFRSSPVQSGRQENDEKESSANSEQELTKQTTPEEVETNPVVEQATELQKVSPTVQSSKRAEEIAEDNQALCQATGENTEVVRKADRAELIA